MMCQALVLLGLGIRFMKVYKLLNKDFVNLFKSFSFTHLK
jgi:hypothetical protein